MRPTVVQPETTKSKLRPKTASRLVKVDTFETMSFTKKVNKKTRVKPRAKSISFTSNEHPKQEDTLLENL